MAKNRYAKDYRLLETFDEKGKVRTKTEYIGEWYCFASGDEQARRVKRILPVMAAAGWVFFIAAMLLQSSAMRYLPAALPFIFIAPPLAVMTDYVFTIRSLPERMEHRFADLLNNRYPPAAMLLLLFPVFALAGEAAALLTGRPLLSGDILFLCCAAFLALNGGGMFALREKLKAVPVR